MVVLSGFSEEQILVLRAGIFKSIQDKAQLIVDTIGSRAVSVDGDYDRHFHDIQNLKKEASELFRLIEQSEDLLAGNITKDPNHKG
jgi:hypothetical protein